LLDALPGDVDELLPALDERAGELAQEAISKLRDRGEREANELRETLERQRGRVGDELARRRHEPEQLRLGFAEDERRQLEADMRSWERRLEQFARDLGTEPDRIADFYEVRAQRIEPVGVVYLWPDTN